MMETGESTSILEYIIIQNDRVFIDICKYGCGSGCAYCYVKSKNKPQELLDMAQIEQICEYIKSSIDCKGKIISLCPNTEPLKTYECEQRVLYIINYFLQLGCYVQISTKEHISDYFLNELCKLNTSKIYINISVPFLLGVEEIEPGAAPIQERLSIFKTIRSYPELNVCLYIKPFIKKSRIEQMEYVRIINENNIKNVCVGVKFLDSAAYQPCTSLYNQTTAEDLFNRQASHINEFISLLRNSTFAKIFGSSVCCINYENPKKCTLRLFEYDPIVCKDCVIWRRTCDETY